MPKPLIVQWFTTLVEKTAERLSDMNLALLGPMMLWFRTQVVAPVSVVILGFVGLHIGVQPARFESGCCGLPTRAVGALRCRPSPPSAR
jgi:hypothetical protein